MDTSPIDKKEQSIRILHVDDEENQLIMTKIFLQKTNSNFIVDSCNSLDEAFKKLTGGTYDCIVSDFKMPKMNGIEFAESVRKMSDIPFILYTGQGSEEVASLAFKIGIDDYLRKEIEPSHYEVLSNRILTAVEHYKSEKNLEKSETRFREITERSFEAIITLDKMGSITYASPAVKKFTGHNPEIFIGKPFTEFVYAPTDKIASEAFMRLQKGETIESIIINATKSDGSQITLETNASPIIQNSEITGFQAVYRDVTERIKLEAQIKEKEQRYRTMFESMEDAVVLYEAIEDGENFVIKDFNRAAEKIENIKKEEIIGRRVTDVFPGVVDFKIFEVFKRVWKTGTPENHPVGLYKDNRIEGWRENYIYKLPSGEIVAIYQDLTEKTHMQNSLERSDLLYKTLVDNIPNAITITVGGKVLFANKKRGELFGDLPSDNLLVGTNILERVIPEDKNKIIERMIARSQGESVSHEHIFRIYDYKENIRTIYSYNIPIVFDDKDAMMHILQDITEQNKLENELRESESMFRALVENSPFGISITHGSEIIYGNKKRLELLGFEENADLKEEFTFRVIPEDREELLKRIEARENGENVEPWFEFRIKDFNEQIRHISSHNRDIEYRGKQATIHMLIDITQQKKLEQELSSNTEKMETKIQEQTKELRIAERMSGAGRIATMLGHDLRGPLQTIKSGVYIMKNMPEDSDETLELIENAADRAADMLVEFRDSVRDQPINPERVNVNEFIQKAIAEIQIPPNVSMNYRKEDIGSTWFDLLSIRRVLDNLVRNAFEAMPDGGEISVETTRTNDIIIEIVDTGVGIRDEDKTKLFTPFFTTKEHGLGIGLAYCQRAVENHGGDIEIESTLGDGTRVTISLPKIDNIPKNQTISDSGL